MNNNQDKNLGGRPPLPPGKARETRLMLRLTNAEKAAYKARAKKAALDVSSWIRGVLKKELEG
jgi:predicted HicB family RNase H-like nuclease